MNQLAQELNATLEGSAALALMSELGKRLYFPKGIVAQSAEAKQKATRFNATIGISTKAGVPMMLSAVKEALPTLKPAEAVAYAPTAGVEDLRARWKAEMKRKNPSLDVEAVSLPVVVPGLTAGLSFTADLFIDAGDAVVIPEYFWDNYPLILDDRKGAEVVPYACFDAAGRFDAKTMASTLERSARKGKVATVLNFPNNPAGFTPSVSEAGEIAAALKGLAEKGLKLLVIVDDAYFGLGYEEGLYGESMFSKLAALHPNLLAVKVDGSTKEDFVWGFRLGFITFGSKGMSAAQYDAMVKKLMGAIRSSVSCCNTPGQFIQMKALDDPRSEGEKQALRSELHARYSKVQAFLKAHPCPKTLQVVPFNSGYFMSFKCLGIGAEALRKKLLEQGIGTISINDKYLRVAFSSVDQGQVEELYKAIFEAAKSM